jgi:hypothetical protein
MSQSTCRVIEKGVAGGSAHGDHRRLATSIDVCISHDEDDLARWSRISDCHAWSLDWSAGAAQRSSSQQWLIVFNPDAKESLVET